MGVLILFFWKSHIDGAISNFFWNMEHPRKEAPLCNPNGKIKNKCAAAVALARQTDTTFAYWINI